MDNASTRAQLLEHFLSFFMPEGILDFFELVWAESQSLDSRESKKASKSWSSMLWADKSPQLFSKIFIFCKFARSKRLEKHNYTQT